MDYYGVPIMEPERSLELNFTSPADCGFCIHWPWDCHSIIRSL